MSTLHPRHHVRRRRTAPEPVNPFTGLTHAIINAFNPRGARSHFSPVHHLPPRGFSRAQVIHDELIMGRAHQDARMMANLRALGINNDTREALIELAATGIQGWQIRHLAHAYQIGKTP